MAKRHTIVKTAALAALAGLGSWLVHSRLRRWGATDDEVAGPFPGAERIPEGRRSSTMAVDIDATPEQVWPWLVQMGWDRGGWYSWDRLDNGGRPSATEVHPEWQDLAVGDQLRFRVFGRVLDAYRVGIIAPNRFLGLYGYTDWRGRWLDPAQPRPSSYMEALWGFDLRRQEDGSTRLVISGYQTFRPRWVERVVGDWLVVALSWPMQARMMAVLKRTVEGSLRRSGRQPADRVEGSSPGSELPRDSELPSDSDLSSGGPTMAAPRLTAGG